MDLLLYTCLTWVTVIKCIFINERAPRQPNSRLLINRDNAAEVCNWCWISRLLSSWGAGANLCTPARPQTALSPLELVSLLDVFSVQTLTEAGGPRSHRLSRGLRIDQISRTLQWEKPSAVRVCGSRLVVFQLCVLTNTLTGDQDHWQDASEALLCLHSPPLHPISSLPVRHYPEVLGAVTRGPQGPQSLSYNDNWPLTACLRGTTTPRLYVFIPLHTVSVPSLLFYLFIFCFSACYHSLWLRLLTQTISSQVGCSS